MKTDLLAVVAKARAFAERVVAVPADGGVSPLGRVLSVEPLVDDSYLILVLSGATAATDQVVVKRRIFSPRVQTSTSVGADYLLVAGDRILASGQQRSSVTYYGRLGRGGAYWKRARRLEDVSLQ